MHNKLVLARVKYHFNDPNFSFGLDFNILFKKKAEIEESIEENDARNITNDTMSEMHEKEISFLTIYGLFGVGQTIAVVFASLLLYLSTLTGAKTLHSKMLSNILRNPLSFFDTTPQVRILEL